ADGACAPGNASLGAVAKPSNLPELATAAGTVATTVDAQAGALRAVDPPGGDKAVIAGVIGALAEVSAPARALQDAAGKTDDAATGRAANELKAKVDAAAMQATSYGLLACGAGLQPPVNTVFEGARTVIKAGFVARADALCTAAARKAAALSDPTSLAALGRFLVAYIPIEEKLLADIKALAVPPGDEAAVGDMVAAQDKVIANDKDMRAAAQKGSAAQADKFDELNTTLITAAHAKFDAYGLRNCGSLGSF
ncbi:MAG: hypothetical protein QOK43_3346, partial [Acidimicrobiaceae bacterium]|nr:hypothetical protein [Acidimicrobiaceae bacterium]